MNAEQYLDQLRKHGITSIRTTWQGQIIGEEHKFPLLKHVRLYGPDGYLCTAIIHDLLGRGGVEIYVALPSNKIDGDIDWITKLAKA